MTWYGSKMLRAIHSGYKAKTREEREESECIVVVQAGVELLEEWG